MYTIQRVENSKPARYKVFFGSLPFSPAMVKRDALEYMQALENNASIYGGWKGVNSRSHEYNSRNHSYTQA